MKHRFTAPFLAVLVLALAAFTGSALAGGSQGSGGGGSSNADKQSSTSASQPATSGDNSHGVKPSNTTKHDTYAKASSDQTKQYGNGKTAGQIATQAGHGDATLRGPGNSHPHKTAACPGGHEVDVHALKNKDANCNSAKETQQVESAKVDVEKSKKTDVDVEKSEKSDVDVQKTDEQKIEESQGVAALTHGHVTICHATGSSSNPYVRISPSASGVFHGHLGHQDGRDIVPPFTWKGQTYSENWDVNGMAIYNAGCTVAPGAAAPAASAVTLTPAASATVAPTAAASATAAAGAVQGAQVTITPAASSPTATPAAAGGVKGAVVALRPTKTKRAGGVLGTTTRLGGSIASTRLPFTGLPLWIFALVAAGLIGIGLTMRRASLRRI
ncbi:MAG TPA: hypothetical protein VIL92_09400 [Gaiellaceae bacterium]